MQLEMILDSRSESPRPAPPPRSPDEAEDFARTLEDERREVEVPEPTRREESASAPERQRDSAEEPTEAPEPDGPESAVAPEPEAAPPAAKPDTGTGTGTEGSPVVVEAGRAATEGEARLIPVPDQGKLPGAQAAVSASASATALPSGTPTRTEGTPSLEGSLASLAPSTGGRMPLEVTAQNPGLAAEGETVTASASEPAGATPQPGETKAETAASLPVDAPQKARFDRLRALADAAGSQLTTTAPDHGATRTSEAAAAAPVATPRGAERGFETTATPTAAEPAPTGESLEVSAPTSGRSAHSDPESDPRHGRGSEDTRGQTLPPLEGNPRGPAPVAGPTANPIETATPLAGTSSIDVTSGVSAKAAPTAPGATTRTTANLDTATVDRIHDQLRVQLSAKRPEMTIRLDPPELGRLHVRLSLERGALVARIDAERAEVVRAFENDVGRLVRTLEDAGLKVGAVDVRHEASAEDRGNEFARSFERPESNAREEDGSRGSDARTGRSHDRGDSRDPAGPPTATESETHASTGRSGALDLVI